MKDIGRNNDELWLKVLRDKIDRFEPDVPQGGWNALDKSINKRKIRRIFYASSVAACILFSILILQDKIFKTDSVINTKTIFAEDKNVTNIVNDNYIAHTNEKQSSLLNVAVKPIKKNIKIITNNIIKERLVQNIVSNIGDTTEQGSISKKNNQVQNMSNGDLNTHKVSDREKDKNNRVILEDESERQWREMDNIKVKKRGKVTASLNIKNNGMNAITSNNKFVSYLSQNVLYSSSSPYIDIKGVKDIDVQNMWTTYKPNLSTLGPDINIFTQKMKSVNGICNYTHKQPFSVGFSIGKELNYNLSIETGLIYTYLSSSINSIDKGSRLDQSLHYIGVPIKLNWNYINKDRYAAYIGGGFVLDKCVSAAIGNESIKIKKFEPYLEFSAGIRLNFNKLVGLYFEPGIIYKFNSSSLLTTTEGFVVKNIYSENKFGLKLEAGLRFAF